MEDITRRLRVQEAGILVEVDIVAGDVSDVVDDVAAQGLVDIQLQADLDLAEVALAAAQLDIIGVEGEILALETVTLPALQTDLDLAEVAIADAQLDIIGVEGAVVTLDTVTIPALQTDLDLAEAAIVANDLDIVAVEGDILTLETVTIPNLQTDLDLAEAAIVANDLELLLKLPIGDAAADVNAHSVTIDGGKLTANTVTANEVAANAITSNELAANAVIAGKIAAGTIVAADIAAGTITATEIAAGTITANEVAANAITSNELAANAVIAGKIAAGTIVAADIATDAITANEIAAGTITAAEISAGAITASELTITVGGGNILGNSEFLYDDSGWSITSPFARAVSDGPFGATQPQSSIDYTNSSGGTQYPGTKHVDPEYILTSPGDKLTCSLYYRQPATCTASVIMYVMWRDSLGAVIYYSQAVPLTDYTGEWVRGLGTVTAPANTHDCRVFVQATTLDTRRAHADITMLQAEWGDVATSWKARSMELLTGSVGTTTIADGAITTDKILARTILAGDIKANEITAAEIKADTITANEIDAGTITAAEIEAGTITASEIASNTIVASNIFGGTITAAEIAAGTITGVEMNATTSITVGTNASSKWVIDGTASGTTSAIHTASASAYGDAGGVWFGADAKISLKDVLTFDGTDLTVKGDVTGTSFTLVDPSDDETFALTHQSVAAGQGGTIDVPQLKMWATSAQASFMELSWWFGDTTGQYMRLGQVNPSTQNVEAGLKVDVYGSSASASLVGDGGDAAVNAGPGGASLHYGGSNWLAVDGSGVRIGGGLDMGGGVISNVNEVVADVGHATDPSYTFDGALDTGMYWAGTDNLGFSTGGQRAVTINDGTLRVFGPDASTSGKLVLRDSGGASETQDMSIDLYGASYGFGVEGSNMRLVSGSSGGWRFYNYNSSIKRAQLTYTGRWTCGNGGAANPTYSFESNTNMGMYRVGTNSLGFSVNGTEQIRMYGADNTNTMRIKQQATTSYSSPHAGVWIRATDTVSVGGSYAAMALSTYYSTDRHVQLSIYQVSGNKIRATSYSNTFIPILASAFTVSSTEQVKKRIRTGRTERGVLDYAIPGPREMAFTQHTKLRPVLFDDLEQEELHEWQGCDEHDDREDCAAADCDGFGNVLLVEHHCDDYDCFGTSERPCWFVEQHIDRPGLIAEEVLEIYPKAVSRDKYGNIEGIDYAVVTVELINTLQHVVEERAELVSRIEALEAGL